MECYLTVTCASFSFLDIYKLKKLYRRGVFTYQRLMCEEFLICKNYWGKK